MVGIFYKFLEQWVIDCTHEGEQWHGRYSWEEEGECRNRRAVREEERISLSPGATACQPSLYSTCLLHYTLFYTILCSEMCDDCDVVCTIVAIEKYI